eukprot:scaffold157351_cov33-Tisochrysis_lutea.AAC.3
MHYREAVQLLREHGPAIGAEQLAALEAEQAAAAAAGDEERSKDMLQLIADEKAHLATVPTHKDDEDLSTKDEKLLGAVVAKVKVGENHAAASDGLIPYCYGSSRLAPTLPLLVAEELSPLRGFRAKTST